MIQTWIDNDRFHRNVMRPEFFLALRLDPKLGWIHDPRPNCYALEDATGVIMFIRLSRAARVHIQFMPVTRAFESRVRSAAGLVRGMAFLEAGLARAGAEQWIFETHSPALASLAKARLGFEASSHEFVREIGYLATEKSQQGPPEAREGGA